MRRPLAQFVKDFIVNGFFRQITERDLEIIYKETVIKRARKSLLKTVAQKGEWMSIDQIRKSLYVMKETVKEKIEKALERAIRAEEIQTEKINKVIKGVLRRSDYGLWKLVHDNWAAFLLYRKVGQDICRIRKDV